MGSGTGVLSVLSEKLGAKNILGIDIDNWAFENAKENTILNNCNRINFEIGDVSNLGNKKFDVISSKLTKSSSLEDAASLFKTVIDTVVGVNFASNNINGIGSEPNFVGAVNALDIGETSTIIKGNNSAYIISIVSKNSGTISLKRFFLRRALSSFLSRASNNSAKEVCF